MEATLAIARTRLASDPGDAAAALRAVQVLLRTARVQRSGGPAREAERILDALLAREPNEYSALKLLGAVYLSQHRFHEAIAVAERGLAVKPNDAWHFGVMGDAWLELGDRPKAFAAFDRMVALRPDAGAYSRVSYALELQGDLRRALEAMTMATDATSADDAEGLAWQHVHLANLRSRLGESDLARLEFGRALHAYPGYPDAVDGMARLDAGLPPIAGYR
jgi:tetratricopeptide (TPR) repeat protein